MKKNYLNFAGFTMVCLFFLLFPPVVFAQSTWQWAKSGGSINNLGNNDEDVSDLLIDKDNNIYMLATIGKSMANVDGIPLITSGAVYGNQSTINHVITSFDCSGGYRWSRVIGGSGGDEMQRIGIDEEGNVYGVGRFIRLNSTYEQFTPVHFRNDIGNDLILPSSITDGQHKESLFMVKYNSQGAFQWLRMPQAPDVTFASISHNRSLDVHVDPSGDLYWLCTIPPGIYANGSFMNTMQGDNLFIFRYDTNGNFLGSFPIDIKGEGSAGGDFIIKRNPATGILYIAGYTFTDGMVTIAGEPVTGGMYIAAFSSDGTYLWKKQSAMAGTSSIRDLVIDAEGALYLTGTTFGGNDQFDGNNIGTGDTTTAPYIIKLDANGNYIWSTTAIAQAATRGFGITVNNTEVAVTGDMNGLQWQGLVSPLVMNINFDVMFARFNKSDGTIISLHKIEGIRDIMTLDQFLQLIMPVITTWVAK